MIELIQALERLLEKGITVEPIYVEEHHVLGTRRPAYRIRLADSTEEVQEPSGSVTVRGW